MDEELNNSDATNDEQGLAEPEGKSDPLDEPKFSQRDIDRLAAKLRREFESKAQKQTTNTTRKNHKPELAEQLATLQEQIEQERTARRFAEATAGMPLTAAQRSMMRGMFAVANPDDADSWASEFVQAFGLTAESKPQKPEPQANEAAAALLNRQPVGQEAIERRTLHPKDIVPSDIERLGIDEVWKYVREFYTRGSVL